MKRHRSVQLSLTAAATPFLAAVVLCALAGWLPVETIYLYLGLSLLTFFAFAKDKAQAVAGRYRIPEKTLLLFSLLGGWPGALIAQQWLRHKTRKQPFLTQLFIAIGLNIAGLTYLASGGDLNQILKYLDAS